MVHAKPTLPSGHGEVLTRPPFEEWAGMAEANAGAAAGWAFQVGGVPAAELRRRARRESAAEAAAFSARLGVPVVDPPAEPALVAVTGHQPEIYHPGVWVKDFLLQRFADESGAVPIDIVVDSDTFGSVGATSPCMRPEVERCTAYLAVGGTDACYACAPAPSPEEIEEFCTAGAESLSTLPAPAVQRHFEVFCACLREAAAGANDLAEAVTFARRRYEAPARTTYLELPLTRQARAASFCTFFSGIALEAERFRECYNAALGTYRRENKTRSPAQPFPDLDEAGGTVELPFWTLAGGVRRAVRVRPRAGGGADVLAEGGETLAELPADTAEACAALDGEAVRLAPKAVPLTLFERLFVADLFIHGVGGARYDRVTDDVIRAFYGVEPPAFVVASMTMYLPIGARIVTDAELEEAEQLLHRLEHNPDQLLDDVDFDSPDERSRARELAREKGELVEAIKAEGADKKALGARIREVNAELGTLLEPVRASLEEDRDRLVAMREAADILTDRTYPLCLWSPLEVQDKVR